MASDAATDTAHAAWDATWRDAEGRAAWETAEASVIETAARLRLAGARDALDLGAGVGRHAIALARLGFSVTALDASRAGLDRVEAGARAAGVAVETVEGRMTALPLADASTDYVLSWNVIYHGDGAVVAATLAEIRRVLRPGGTFQATMLPRRNRHHGRGREIAPATWVNPEAGGDKGHPHFYCDAGELCALLDGFEIVSLALDEHDGPGDWHWRLTAEAVRARAGPYRAMVARSQSALSGEPSTLSRPASRNSTMCTVTAAPSTMATA
jgi:SAM-dependent methyltransferase